MQLKDHIWTMFKLGITNDVDLSNSKDLFYSNCTDGEATYSGAPEEDWTELADAYKKCRDLAKQKKEVNAIIRKNYDALCTAFQSGNKDEFVSIVNGTQDI